MRTCLSRGVPADHEARSQVKVREKSSSVGKKALTGGHTRCRDRNQRCGDTCTAMQETQQRHSTAAQQRNRAKDTAEQQEQTKQIASVIENLTPIAEAMTQRSWRTDQTERTRYLICYCCPVSEAAMKHPCEGGHSP